MSIFSTLEEIVDYVDTAIAKLEVGYKFIGAFGEAKLLELHPDSPEWNLFVKLYAARARELDWQVDIDTNVILSITLPAEYHEEDYPEDYPEEYIVSEEDEGQPSHYEEMQDFMGGDDGFEGEYI